jgi:hypothetical protein
MLGLGIGLHKNNFVGSVSFDADYQAILDYATTQGYTLPSINHQIKQNTLLSSLKTAGVWSKLDTFANFATDGSINFALIDWKRLTQYTNINSATFTINEGFTGNGTSSYLSTNFNPQIGTNNYALNNASRYIFLFNGSNILDGTPAFGRNRISIGNSALQTINQDGNGLNSAFNYTSTKGMKSIHRTSSTNVELFNDTIKESRTANSTSITSTSQLILRSSSAYSNSKISMYAMGCSLVSENTAFVNAYNTYINSL